MTSTSPEPSLAAPAPQALELDGVSFDYGARPVLDDVRLQLRAGVIAGLVGPNGSGKTTLLKLAGGLLPPKRGQVRYAGRELESLSPRARAQHRAYVPQSDGEPFPYSVGEVVAMGRAHTQRLYAAPQPGAEVRALLDELGFTAALTRRYDALSGGERQLVLIARALLQNSPLLLLDEPTSHLDLKHQAAVARAIKRRARAGAAVVWSLHDLNLAAAVCDVLFVLARGRIVSQGSPTEALSAELVTKVYDVALRVRHDTSGPRVELALDDEASWG